MWYYELSDMIKQLDSDRLIFFTFSSANLYWPELHKLMPLNENLKVDNMKHHHKNLIKNPHIAA